MDGYGALTLLAKNGAITGQLTTHDQVYEIRPLGEDLYAFITVDLGKFNYAECGNIGSAAPAPTPAPAQKLPSETDRKGAPNARLADCPAGPVRVLVFWTQAAINAMGWNELQTRIDLVIAQTNDAFRNSGISTRIEEAARMGIGIQERQFEVFRDVEALANRVDVQGIRDQFNADIVVMMTDGNYTDPRTGGRIFGQALNFGPSDPQAYAIVEAQEATASYTFAHELGHLFGARHQQNSIYNPCDNIGRNCGDDTEGDAHGYAFRTGWINQQKWYTIMHQIRDNWAPRLYFSNPQVEVQNTTIGAWGQNNNARQIEDATVAVAGFRPTTQGLRVGFSGPTYLPLYQSGDWEAVYSCGTGPYSFEWYFSWDGFNYYYVSDQETVSGSHYNCNETLFIRLVVRSADGQVAENHLGVSTDPCSSDPYRVASSGKETSVLPNEIALKEAYPNPFEKSTTIAFFLPESQAATLEVTDLNGRTVKVLAEGRQEAGWHQREFNSGSLSGGVYLYRLKTKNQTQTKRLVILK